MAKEFLMHGCHAFLIQVTNQVKTKLGITRLNWKGPTMSFYSLQLLGVPGWMSRTSCRASIVMLKKRRCGSQKRLTLCSPQTMDMIWIVPWFCWTSTRFVEIIFQLRWFLMWDRLHCELYFCKRHKIEWCLLLCKEGSILVHPYRSRKKCSFSGFVKLKFGIKYVA